jgi:glyoxylase-like metal-dependent hydrolase (beta-lactamase superfamily II)
MSDAELPHYEIYAIRYAHRESTRNANFLMRDPHDGPMALDYFVWVAVAPERTVVIDTGFTEETAKRLKRDFLRCPAESLGLIGQDPRGVADVIITHLHYDHVGNFHKFPAARFHLQESEMAYATGRHMRHHVLNHAYNLDDILGMVRLNYEGRVFLYGGERELAPGITMHPVGGHTPGMQFVRVHTGRGWVVLASDCSHFYANMETFNPFIAIVDVPATVEGYEKLYEAAPSPAHIVPGHDPDVMKRYPAPAKELEGMVVRLDVAPLI